MIPDWFWLKLKRENTFGISMKLISCRMIWDGSGSDVESDEDLGQGPSGSHLGSLSSYTSDVRSGNESSSESLLNSTLISEQTDDSNEIEWGNGQFP
ncbi:hypothetical protein M8J77_025717 [Diaphorina citri]|nr:hypothetical protein M8J77_025717 [Diaphorina citri]